jgi:hypothetical protein
MTAKKKTPSWQFCKCEKSVCVNNMHLPTSKQISLNLFIGYGCIILDRVDGTNPTVNGRKQLEQRQEADAAEGFSLCRNSCPS